MSWGGWDSDYGGLDPLNEFVDVVPCADDRFPGSSLAEDYAEARRVCHVHLVGSRIGLPPQEFCLLVHAERLIDPQPLGGEGLPVIPRGVRPFDLAGVPYDSQRRLDDAVLVRVIESGEDGEDVVFRSIPSVVWLRLIDDCPEVLRNRSESFVSLSGPLAWWVPSGEEVVVLGGGDGPVATPLLSAFTDGEDDVVEGGSQT